MATDAPAVEAPAKQTRGAKALNAQGVVYAKAYRDVKQAEEVVEGLKRILAQEEARLLDVMALYPEELDITDVAMNGGYKPGDWPEADPAEGDDGGSLLKFTVTWEGEEEVEVVDKATGLLTKTRLPVKWSTTLTAKEEVFASTFGGQEAVVAALKRSRRYAGLVKQTVHHGSLNALVKERVLAGDKLPPSFRGEGEKPTIGVFKKWKVSINNRRVAE